VLISFVQKVCPAAFGYLLSTAYQGLSTPGWESFILSASRAFFGKSPGQLSREQAARLAAVLPNPLRLHAEYPSWYVEERSRWSLEQMELLGGISYLRDL
jgi:membrane peptidoglycan carboxypeptidase